MSSTRLLLLCLLGISAIFFRNSEARSARRLEPEGIVGGDDAAEGQFPYQVSLESGGSSYCGGSILSERFILTAAHCVVGDDGKFFKISIKVVAGISDLKSKSKDKVSVDVIEAYVPKEFNPLDKSKPVTGDIAVLKLNKDLGIAGNSKLAEIKLPLKDENYDGVKATASGFGFNSIDVITIPTTGEQVEWNGRRFKKLRYATAQVLSSDDCLPYRDDISESHMCAALVQRKKDEPEGVCGGDSGGPLVYERVQIGVVSASPVGCREDIEPAIYTRVSSYIDFINKVIDGKIDDSIRSNTLKIK